MQQVVTVSDDAPFELSVIAMPGATISDGECQLLNGKKLQDFDYIIIGLGTNNINKKKFDEYMLRSELFGIIKTTKRVYPKSKVYHIKFLLK